MLESSRKSKRDNQGSGIQDLWGERFCVVTQQRKLQRKSR